MKVVGELPHLVSELRVVLCGLRSLSLSSGRTLTLLNILSLVAQLNGSVSSDVLKEKFQGAS